MSIQQRINANGTVESALIRLDDRIIQVTPDGLAYGEDFESTLPLDCGEGLCAAIGAEAGDRRWLLSAIAEALVPQYDYA